MRLRGEELENVARAVSARHGLGQAAHCATGKLRTRVIQGLRIKLYSQTVPSQRGLGDHIIQQFTTLATLGIISLSNIPMLRPYPRDADIRGLGSAWALVYFKAFSGNLEGPPVGRITDPVQRLLSLQ